MKLFNKKTSKDLNRARTIQETYEEDRRIEQFDKIDIDQSPIGKTPRSRSGNMQGVFDLITISLRNFGLKAKRIKRRFSFNVKGGRYVSFIKERCEFVQRLKCIFQVYVLCRVCDGTI